MKRYIDLAMLDRLDRLIRMKATGPPGKLAVRLGISRTTLNETLFYLRKALHAPIRYNEYIQSYIYDFLPDFYLGFEKDKTHLRNNQCV